MKIWNNPSKSSITVVTKRNQTCKTKIPPTEKPNKHSEDDNGNFKITGVRPEKQPYQEQQVNVIYRTQRHSEIPPRQQRNYTTTRI